MIKTRRRKNKKRKNMKLTERERENKWHEQFYALQRKGLPSNLAGAIATKNYGKHSDKMRTEADHKRTYQHLVRGHSRRGTRGVRQHVRRTK
jgi:predicted transposase YbfD/YdcC